MTASRGPNKSNRGKFSGSQTDGIGRFIKFYSDGELRRSVSAKQVDESETQLGRDSGLRYGDAMKMTQQALSLTVQ